MTILSERNLEIAEMHNAGHDFTEISKQYGISPLRVRQICISVAQRKKWNEEHKDFTSLSVRVANALVNNNIRTKEFLLECLNHPNGAGIEEPFGEKMLAELEDFVGFKISCTRQHYYDTRFRVYRTYKVLKRVIE